MISRSARVTSPRGPDGFTGGPADFSGPGAFATGPGDFSTGPHDFSTGPGNFSTGPGDYTGRSPTTLDPFGPPEAYSGDPSGPPGGPSAAWPDQRVGDRRVHPGPARRHPPGHHLRHRGAAADRRVTAARKGAGDRRARPVDHLGCGARRLPGPGNSGTPPGSPPAAARTPRRPRHRPRPPPAATVQREGLGQTERLFPAHRPVLPESPGEPGGPGHHERDRGPVHDAAQRPGVRGVPRDRQHTTRGVPPSSARPTGAATPGLPGTWRLPRSPTR